MADGLVMPDRSEEQEGVFSFYLGEMRARARTAAIPGRAESEEAIGLGMIHEIGTGSSRSGLTATPKGSPRVMEQVRADYEALRIRILDEAEEIRAARLENGAELR
jgi:hypothetical protein